LGRHQLRRHDEVALVLAVFVVDDDHQLTARDRVDGPVHPVERHRVVSVLVRRRSTYFAITSASRFTVSPTRFVPRVVTASVCGITATEHASACTAATVRLTPSTAIDPLCTT